MNEPAFIAREAVERFFLRVAPGPARCLVAVSGGMDSVSLLHLLSSVAPELDLTIAVGHVNHQLRGAESDGDQAFVRSIAAALGVPCFVETAEPMSVREGRSSQQRHTVQEAARQVRYRALRKLAKEWGANFVATAHTADDQAETILLRMFRGCGPEAVAGIPEQSPDGTLLRPLLKVDRREIRGYAEHYGLAWREDSSNENIRYARNRLRREWLPGLKEAFNPQLVQALSNLAHAQQRDDAWMNEEVDREWARRVEEKDGEIWVDCAGWRTLPEALAWRLGRRLLRAAGGARDVTRSHLERFLEALSSDSAHSGEVQFPGGLRLERRRDRARLFRVEQGPAC